MLFVVVLIWYIYNTISETYNFIYNLQANILLELLSSFYMWVNWGKKRSRIWVCRAYFGQKRSFQTQAVIFIINTIHSSPSTNKLILKFRIVILIYFFNRWRLDSVTNESMKATSVHYNGIKETNSMSVLFPRYES